jgi:hypothetical protein
VSTRRVQVISSTPSWGFRAALSRPHDGDSFFMLADTGFGGRHEAELRLDGVRAPEIHPMQPGGQETLDFVNGWLQGVQVRAPARRWPFWLQVVATTTYEPGMDMSFTRYVAMVWAFVDGEGADPSTSLNAYVNTFLSGHPEWPQGD